MLKSNPTTKTQKEKQRSQLFKVRCVCTVLPPQNKGTYHFMLEIYYMRHWNECKKEH